MEPTEETLAPKCRQTLQSILSRQGINTAPESHDPDSFEAYYRQVMEMSLPKIPGRTQYHPVKYLVYRFNDLRPNVQQNLETQLLIRWQMAPGSVSAARVNTATASALRTSEPKLIKTAPENPETIPNRHLSTAASTPLMAEKQDLFDRFVTWVACLMGQL